MTILSAIECLIAMMVSFLTPLIQKFNKDSNYLDLDVSNVLNERYKYQYSLLFFWKKQINSIIIIIIIINQEINN